MLRGTSAARWAAASLFTFYALTCLPMVATPVVQTIRGESAQTGILVPAALLALIMGFAAKRLAFAAQQPTSPNAWNSPPGGRRA